MFAGGYTVLALGAASAFRFRTPWRKRPSLSVMDLTASCGLTDDDIRILIAYKLEKPFPLAKWLNALLTCNRRDDVIVAKGGPCVHAAVPCAGEAPAADVVCVSLQFALRRFRRHSESLRGMP